MRSRSRKRMMRQHNAFDEAVTRRNATALQGQRRFAEAAREFGRALENDEALVTADSANAEYRRNRGEILAWLADAQFGEGRLFEAIRTRQRQLALLEQSERADPQDLSLLQEDRSGDPYEPPGDAYYRAERFKQLEERDRHV